MASPTDTDGERMRGGSFGSNEPIANRNDRASLQPPKQEGENMSPIDWAKRPLQKYADFTGRAPRAEFWWFALLIMVAATIGTILDSLFGMTKLAGPYGLITLLILVATLVPSLAVQTRRLHDTDRSGIWLVGFYIPYFIYLYLVMGAMKTVANMQVTGEVPTNTGSLMLTGLVGLVVLVLAVILIVFYVKRGTTGDNRYGPDPYGADAGATIAV
jgi:uncharacterized membrane protein YhaH (DUF805 family)